MKRFKKRYFILGFIVIVIIAYAAGPSPQKPKLNPEFPKVSSDLNELEKEVYTMEKAHPSIKPGCEAKIIWADSTKKLKTRYSVVYLHGFSASRAEGDPVHQDFASRYGFNLYLSRLEQHGVDTADIFINLTPENLFLSAQKAVAIAQQLGDSVIIMATSNGGALALKIASDHPEVAALIIYSPLIDFYDPATVLLDKPWGLQIAHQVIGGENYDIPDKSPNNVHYWTTKYRLEGTVALKNMIVNMMTKETFEKVKQPVFLGYYYKNEEEQDKVVSVPAMLKMYDELGTPANLKRKIAFPKSGHHVIGSKYKSNDVNGVETETFKFADEILKLKPLK